MTIENKVLIKCDKCGSTKVIDEEKEEIKITVLSMDEYIERNKFYWMVENAFKARPEVAIIGTSYGQTRILRCEDCGHEKEYFRVVYT